MYIYIGGTQNQIYKFQKGKLGIDPNPCKSIIKPILPCWQASMDTNSQLGLKMVQQKVLTHNDP